MSEKNEKERRSMARGESVRKTVRKTFKQCAWL